MEEVPHAIPLPSEWRGLLTPQQQGVTSLILCWEDNLAIADRLDCARNTVKAHIRNIFDKLGVDSRAQLIALAFKLGRGDPPSTARSPDKGRLST